MDTYDGYNYDRFRRMAKDASLSKFEKIGFPDEYRANSEKAIFEDVLAKIPLLGEERELTVLDIGPGCSDLQAMIVRFCGERGHRLFFADSAEMLELVDDAPCLVKVPGRFPDTAKEIRAKSGGIDVIICYSVLHYIFAEGNVWYFLDWVMELMNDGGQGLIGDIPNISKRKRFFASPNGIRYHQRFMNTTGIPEVVFNRPEPGKIDDAFLLSMAMHCHASGCDAYVMPQAKGLPFANRRDDFVILKP